jgi:hypothetical protein
VDLNVVLDHVTDEDVEAMVQIVSRLPNRKLACGWLGGVDELGAWPVWDRAGTYMAYEVLAGSMEVLPPLSEGMLIESIAANLSAINHEARYRRIYHSDTKEQAAKMLRQQKIMGHTLRAYALLRQRYGASGCYGEDTLDQQVQSLQEDMEPQVILATYERWSSSLLKRLGEAHRLPEK